MTLVKLRRSLRVARVHTMCLFCAAVLATTGCSLSDSRVPANSVCDQGYLQLEQVDNAGRVTVVCRMLPETVNRVVVQPEVDALNTLSSADPRREVFVTAALVRSLSAAELRILQDEKVRILLLHPGARTLSGDTDDPYQALCTQLADELARVQLEGAPIEIAGHYLDRVRECESGKYPVYGVTVKGPAQKIVRWTSEHAELIRRIRLGSTAVDSLFVPPRPEDPVVEDIIFFPE